MVMDDRMLHRKYSNMQRLFLQLSNIIYKIFVKIVLYPAENIMQKKKNNNNILVSTMILKKTH